jgi:hypothetical protein
MECTVPYEDALCVSLVFVDAPSWSYVQLERRSITGRKWTSFHIKVRLVAWLQIEGFLSEVEYREEDFWVPVYVVFKFQEIFYQWLE